MRQMLQFGIMMCLVFVMGCRTSDKQNASSETAKKKVGILVQTTVNPFFLDLAEAAQKELGDSFEVTTFGGDNSADKQAKQIKDLVVQKFDALLITPCNANAVGAPIRDANEAGIPVFTAATACLDPDVKIENHVATDNLAGGRLAAGGGGFPPCREDRLCNLASNYTLCFLDKNDLATKNNKNI